MYSSDMGRAKWVLIALAMFVLELPGGLGYVPEPLPTYRPNKSFPVKRDESAIYFPESDTEDDDRLHTGSKRSLTDSDVAPARFSDLYPQTSFFNAERPARQGADAHGPQNGWGNPGFNNPPRQQNRPNWGGGGNQPWGNGGGNFNRPPFNNNEDDDDDDLAFVFDRPPPSGGGRPGRPQPGNGGVARPQPGNGRPGRPQPGNGGVARPQPGNGRPGRPQPGNGGVARPQPGNGGVARPQPGNGRPGRPQPGNGGVARPQPGNGRPGRPQPGTQRPGNNGGDRLTLTPVTITARPTAAPTTRPAPGAPVTAPTPAPTRAGCNCPSTPEFNPVCGQDRVTYTNPGKLRCANACGNNVMMLHFGACVTTTTPPPS